MVVSWRAATVRCVLVVGSSLRLCKQQGSVLILIVNHL